MDIAIIFGPLSNEDCIHIRSSFWSSLQSYLVLFVGKIAIIFGPHDKNYCNYMWSSPILSMKCLPFGWDWLSSIIFLLHSSSHHHFFFVVLNIKIFLYNLIKKQKKVVNAIIHINELMKKLMWKRRIPFLWCLITSTLMRNHFLKKSLRKKYEKILWPNILNHVWSYPRKSHFLCLYVCKTRTNMILIILILIIPTVAAWK